MRETLFDRVAGPALDLWAACVDEDTRRLMDAAQALKARLVMEGIE